MRPPRILGPHFLRFRKIGYGKNAQRYLMIPLSAIDTIRFDVTDGEWTIHVPNGGGE
jgi:hypothetical protein